MASRIPGRQGISRPSAAGRRENYSAAGLLHRRARRRIEVHVADKGRRALPNVLSHRQTGRSRLLIGWEGVEFSEGPQRYPGLRAYPKPARLRFPDMTQYLFLMIGRPAAPGATDTVTKDYNAKWMAWIGD